MTYVPQTRVKVIDLGVIRSADDSFVVGRKYQASDESGFLGTIGKIAEENSPLPNARFYASPYRCNPFITTNGVRYFSNRQSAIAWLMGVRDAKADWMRLAGENLRD